MRHKMKASTYRGGAGKTPAVTTAIVISSTPQCCGGQHIIPVSWYINLVYKVRVELETKRYQYGPRTMTV